MGILRLGIGSSPEVLHSASWTKRLFSCDVLLFPELSDGGYAALANGAAPLLPTDRYFRAFRQVSQLGRLTCIAGSAFVRDDAGRCTNTSFVFTRGREVFRYDKIHLFRPLGDHRYFSPGSSFGTFSVPLQQGRLRGGVVICYDLRFPEMARLMALEGMQLLCVPARWPVERDDAWQTLLKARAVENQIFVAGCNSRAPEGGYSYVFDPLGELVWSNRQATARPFAKVLLNLDRLRDARSLHRNLRDARLLRCLTVPSRVMPPIRRLSPSRKRGSGKR